MKKFTALIITLLVALCCLPFAAGCKFSERYTLKYDEDGTPYYVFSCTGYASNLEGEYTVLSHYGEGDSYAPVTEIAEQGLCYTKLTKITVPATVKKIGAAAFAYNYFLTDIIFEDGIELEEIPAGAFGYGRSLKTVKLPDGVKTIGAMAFINCERLEEVSFPEGLTTIGDRAFNYTALKEIAVPGSVKDIKDGDKTVYGIGYGAFHTCEKLTTVKISGEIEEIPSGAFGYCPALETLYLPASLKKIQGAYFNDKNKVVYGHAFHYNTALKDIYFAGTAAEWNAVTVENERVSVQTVVYDNSAIINATMHYGS